MVEARTVAGGGSVVVSEGAVSEVEWVGSVPSKLAHF